MEGLEKRPSVGGLGAGCYDAGLPSTHHTPKVILDKDDELCLNCFIHGGCECTRLSQGEPGIKYLLKEGMPRKGSSLAKHSGPI